MTQNSDSPSILYAKDSNVISFLRLPLAFLVVFIHAESHIEGWQFQNMHPNDWGANFCAIFITSFSHILSAVAVPCFFLISGYLFFLKGFSLWDSTKYLSKVYTRVKTILIPYILWVTFFFLVHLIRYHFSSISYTEWDNAFLNCLNENGWGNIYWSCVKWVSGITNIWGEKVMMAGPFAFHLWFLRDLFLVSICAPIFYFLLKLREGAIHKYKVIFSLIFLSFLYFSQVQNPFYITFTSVFWFAFGAFLSLNSISLSNCFYKRRNLYAIAAFLFFILLVVLNGTRTALGSIISPFFIFVGVITTINYASHLVLKYPKQSELIIQNSGGAFLIYILHPFYLAIVTKVIIAIALLLFSIDTLDSISFCNNYPYAYILIYFTKILGAITLCFLTYYITKRFFPNLLKYLCGR